MDTQRIESELAEKRQILGLIEQDLETAKTELAERKKIHNRGVLSNAGKATKLPSLETQRRRVADALVDVQGLEETISDLSGKIEALESEKALASLHALHVGTFERSLQSTQAVKDIGAGLSEKISELNGAVGSLMTDIETGIGAVMAVHRHIGADVSLQAFMAGEIERTDDSADHEEVLAQIGARLQAIVRDVPMLETKSLGTLLERLEMLQAWRVKVLGFEPLALMKNRQSLVGKPAKKTKHPVSEFSPPPYDFILRNRDKYSEGDVQKAETALLARRKRYDDEQFARYYPNERA